MWVESVSKYERYLQADLKTTWQDTAVMYFGLNSFMEPLLHASEHKTEIHRKDPVFKKHPSL